MLFDAIQECSVDEFSRWFPLILWYTITGGHPDSEDLSISIPYILKACFG